MSESYKKCKDLINEFSDNVDSTDREYLISLKTEIYEKYIKYISLKKFERGEIENLSKLIKTKIINKRID